MKAIEVRDSQSGAVLPVQPGGQIEKSKTQNAGASACVPCCARCKSPLDTEDELLVQGCLQGDQHAWEALIDKYKRLIYSIPIRYGATREDAADVFQAVCIEVFHSLSRLKNVGSLRSWLITLAVRQSYRWKRKQSHHVELDAMEQEIAEQIATAPETLAQLEQEQIVREVVSKLPPRCAELVQMLFFEQPPLPYAEAARRLGLATGSIGFIRGRCLERLRKLLLESGFQSYVSDDFREHERREAVAGVRQ